VTARSGMGGRPWEVGDKWLVIKIVGRGQQIWWGDTKR